MKRHQFRGPIGLFLAATLVLLVFWPGLNGGFIFDDIPNITAHSSIQIEDLSRDSLQQAWSAYSGGLFLGRPLAAVSFGIDHARAGGMFAWHFKQTSLFLHLLNTLLVFLLVTQLLRADATRASDHIHNRQDTNASTPGWPAWAALAIAIIWAIHPLQVSTVLYVVQRMEMLAVTFTLLALIAYCFGRRRQIEGQAGGWLLLTGAAASTAIGLLAKETAILIPVFTLGLELTVFRFRARQPVTATTLKGLYGIGMITGLAWFAFGLAPRYLAPDAYQYRPFDVRERLLTQLRVLPMYLSFIAYPAPDRMLFFYDAYSISRGWLQPVTTLLGGLFLLGLAVLAFFARKTLPLLSLAVIWFFTAHLLTSNIISLELVFEHRNYFAVMPVLIGLAALLRLIGTSKHARIPPGLLVLATIGLLTILTLIRSATWGDPTNLALHHSNISPKSERAKLETGYVFASLSGGNPDSPLYYIAVRNLELASELPGSSPLPEQMLILLAASGRTEARDEWWERFLQKLKTGPLDAQTNTAVTSLLKARRHSLPINDEWLLKTFRTLANRKEGRAELMMQFALYAIEVRPIGLQSDEVLHAAAAKIGPHEQQAERWAEFLVAQGHTEHALILLRLANAHLTEEVPTDGDS